MRLTHYSKPHTALAAAVVALNRRLADGAAPNDDNSHQPV